MQFPIYFVTDLIAEIVIIVRDWVLGPDFIRIVVVVFGQNVLCKQICVILVYMVFEQVVS